MIRSEIFLIAMVVTVPVMIIRGIVGGIGGIGDGLKYMVTDNPNSPRIILWGDGKPKPSKFCPIWGDGPCKILYR